MIARTRLGGVQTQSVITVPAGHFFWQIKEDAGELLFQTSADGEAWTTWHQASPTFALFDLQICLYAGYWGAGSHEDKWMEWEAVHISR